MSADRALMPGRSGSGKSTLMAHLIDDFARTYVNEDRTGWNHAKAGRILIIDNKPRWRATKSITGYGLGGYYKRQGYVVGDTVPNSVLMSHPNQWDLAFNPDISSRIVVAQRSDIEDDALIVQWQVDNIRRYFASQRPDEPSLLVIDEGMDFFGPSGSSRYGNAIQRCYRAGREKGMAVVTGVQRPRCINLQCLTESNVLYLFAIDFDEDVKRLREMGYPKGEGAPTKDYEFRLFKDKKLYPKKLRLKEAA